MKDFNIQQNKWYLLTLAEMVVADYYNNYRKKHSLPLADFCKFKNSTGNEFTSKEVANGVHKEALQVEDLILKPIEEIKNVMYSIAETHYSPT